MAVWINVAIVLGLILVEALFVASEMALVSLRESQVNAIAERSGKGARVKHLVADPNRFLSAVQLGTTLTALMSSAFGEVTLVDSTAKSLRDAGLNHTMSQVIAFAGVLLVITYLTLVVGELAPKRMALQRAEGIATTVAGFIDRFATITRPVIWFLSQSTDVIVELLGGDKNANREAITEEELRDLVAAHESLTTDERRLIDEVFAAGERQVREVMVPRTEVDFLDGELTVAQAAALTRSSPHSRYPVFGTSHDDVIGFLHLRDLFAADNAPSTKVSQVIREVATLPDTKKVLSALSEMRRAGQHLAIVIDEYGGTAGIVTLEDLIEEVIGDIRDEYDVARPTARRLLTGEMEVDGLLNLTDFEELTGIELEEGPYETAAGYVMSNLGHLPAVGEAVEVGTAKLTVSGLDGRRVSRVRVSPLNPEAITAEVQDNGQRD
jgi:putative hemolysin